MDNVVIAMYRLRLIQSTVRSTSSEHLQNYVDKPGSETISATSLLYMTLES